MALKWRMVWMAGPGVTVFGPSVTEAESGGVVRLSPGEVLTVELKRREGGPMWRRVSPLPAGVLQVQREETSPTASLVNHFEFRATGPGVVNLRLAPHVSLVNGASPFELRVEVG